MENPDAGCRDRHAEHGGNRANLSATSGRWGERQSGAEEKGIFDILGDCFWEPKIDFCPQHLESAATAAYGSRVCIVGD